MHANNERNKQRAILRPSGEHSIQEMFRSFCDVCRIRPNISTKLKNKQRLQNWDVK